MRPSSTRVDDVESCNGQAARELSAEGLLDGGDVDQVAGRRRRGPIRAAARRPVSGRRANRSTRLRWSSMAGHSRCGRAETAGAHGVDDGCGRRRSRECGAIRCGRTVVGTTCRSSTGRWIRPATTGRTSPTSGSSSPTRSEAPPSTSMVGRIRDETTTNRYRVRGVHAGGQATELRVRSGRRCHRRSVATTTSGSDFPVWSNRGETVLLLDPEGSPRGVGLRRRLSWSPPASGVAR